MAGVLTKPQKIVLRYFLFFIFAATIENFFLP